MLKHLVKNTSQLIKDIYFSNFVAIRSTHMLTKPLYTSQFHGDSFWDKRACGMACIFMLIKTFNPDL